MPRRLRSSSRKERPLSAMEFRQRHVYPVLGRLGKKGVACIKDSGDCCVVCCRNDVLKSGITHFVRLYDHECDCAYLHCVVGDHRELGPMLQREFARGGVALVPTTTAFVFGLRPFRKSPPLWKKVRTHLHALAFTSWLKKLVAERRYHPTRIDFEALSAELDADICELNA